MPQGKNALLRVLSRKANMELEAFMAVKEAVYIFRYHVDEKVRIRVEMRERVGKGRERVGGKLRECQRKG